MRVEIHLFGAYLKYAERSPLLLELPEGATPLSVAERLGIPRTPDLWVLVNGRREPVVKPLADGDAVYFFQPIGGGGATTCRPIGGG